MVRVENYKIPSGVKRWKLITLGGQQVVCTLEDMNDLEDFFMRRKNSRGYKDEEQEM